MKRIVLFLTIVLAAAFATGCVSGPVAASRSAPPGETALAGPLWLLSGFLRESGFVPLEPGHGTSARILMHDDGTFEGTTGWTVFTGKWNAKSFRADKTAEASFTISKFRSEAPDAASQQFEDDLIGNLLKTRSVRKGQSAIRLLDAADEPLLEFISSSR